MRSFLREAGAGQKRNEIYRLSRAGSVGSCGEAFDDLNAGTFR
jgi:hypothetical protein